jgi:PcaR/PcaU/PobR family beta-ketoadipate pathway transcriptional regulator
LPQNRHHYRVLKAFDALFSLDKESVLYQRSDKYYRIAEWTHKMKLPQRKIAAEKDRNFVESIERGMNVFSFIVNSKKAVGITQISKALNLSLGSVQRVTYTLQKLGYLRKDEEIQKYSIGHNGLVLGLGIVKDLDLKRVAHPYLRELSAEIDETVNLAVLDGIQIVYLDRVKTGQIININLSIGSKLPVYCTSMGKSLLAFLPNDELVELLNKINLKPITPNTITTKARLLRELEKVKKRGFSVNDKELDIGLRSVAAPVRNEYGTVVAAVNIAVPSSRVTFEELRTKFAGKVIHLSRVISEALGYREPS